MYHERNLNSIKIPSSISYDKLDLLSKVTRQTMSPVTDIHAGPGLVFLGTGTQPLSMPIVVCVVISICLI